MNNTIINYLLIISSIYLTLLLARTTYYTTEDVKESIKNREKREQFTNNHPEMKGIDIDEDDLLVFSSGERIKDRVLMNDDESDNIPLMTKLIDEIELDDDD